MNSLKKLLLEKLILNNQSKLAKAFVDNKRKIKVDIDGCWIDKPYIDKISEFAYTLKYRPFIISNKTRKPGKRWEYGTNIIYIFFEKSYNPHTYIRITYEEYRSGSSHWTYCLYFNNEFICANTHESLEELFVLLKKDIDKHNFFEKT